MNAPVVAQVSKLEQFRQQVLPPDKARDLWNSLPAHIKPAVFERNLLNALMQNPDLIGFPAPLVYREVSKAAGLGLLLDPQLGEAYIVVAWNSKTQRKEPQLRVGYKGMCKLARQAGDVTGLYAHEVCEQDKFHCQLGTDKRIDHEPNMLQDRGKVALYYAVIKFKDGSFDFEAMTLKQVRDIRDRSDAWKAFKADKIKSTPWSTDEDEMAKKTVLRRLLKRQPRSPELTEAIGIEDTAEFEIRNVTPQRGAADDGPPAPPPARAIEHKPAPAPSAQRGDADLVPGETMDPQTGEVTWSEPAQQGDGLDIPPMLDRRKPTAPPTVPETGTQAWLRDLEGAFSSCEDMETFSAKQKEVMMPQKGKVPPDAWERAQWLAHDTFKRIQAND